MPELRIATAADAGEIAALVNRAYRPAPQDAGWTHESGLVGGARTNREQVLALLHDGSAVLLLCEDARIIACVHVQNTPSGASIGMLATEPGLQAKGLGKQMLLHAETHAMERFAARRLKISVLSSRPELLAFYQRRAYVLTGETAEYPHSGETGHPMVDGLHLLLLGKDVHGLPPR